MKGFRKRILVTEGDLMRLWSEVTQVRDKEQRTLFKQEFKQILHDAGLVSLTKVEKGVVNG